MVFDGNIPIDTMATLLEMCQKYNKPGEWWTAVGGENVMNCNDSIDRFIHSREFMSIEMQFAILSSEMIM